MYLRKSSAIPLLSILLTIGATVGCQSMPPASPQAGRSVIAGGTTFIEVPNGQGGRQVIAYTEPGRAVCPECQAVAENYFRTGVLDERSCKTCGATFIVGRGSIMQP